MFFSYKSMLLSSFNPYRSRLFDRRPYFDQSKVFYDIFDESNRSFSFFFWPRQTHRQTDLSIRFEKDANLDRRSQKLWRNTFKWIG